MTVVNVWVGATTHDRAVVVAKVTGASTRLAYDTDPGMSAPTYTAAAVPSATDIVRFTISGLTPGTRYYYAVEDDAVLDTSYPGQFLTHPGPPGSAVSFRFGHATCAGIAGDYPAVGDVLAPTRISSHPVFAQMRALALEESWLFFSHGGDFHYYDIGSGVWVGDSTATTYRRAIDDVLLQPDQHDLYRSVPLIYTWDDHDYGPNDSDRTAPGRANALNVMRERFPLPGMGSSDPNEGNFYAYEVGRTLFIVSDTRSNSDPKSDPQSAAKTMLGAAQLAWMEAVLATSTAEVLFWVNSRQWLGNFADGWGSFTHERARIVSMLQAPGGDASRDWTSRMCILSGDAHSIGIASGAANPYGGFPIYQMASLDSTPGVIQDHFDIASIPGRGQYGAFSVEDTGERITVTCTAYTETTPLVTHSFHVDTPTDPGPDPEPEPPPVSTATATSVVQWAAFDSATGDIVAWLPGMTGDIERQLCAYSTASLTLPSPLWGRLALGPLATVVTQPVRTWLVCIINSKPAWLGYITKVQDGVGVTVSVSAATLEAALDNLYVTTQTHTSADESVIVKGLLAPALESGLHMVVDAPATGTLRDRQYHDTDDATIYARLQELADVEGGPEWTITPEWETVGQRIVAVFRLRPRIGKIAPTVQFSTTGTTRARWTRTRDYSRGRFATRVLATGSGEGDDRRQSAVHVATSLEAAGYPRTEYRWSPSSSITETSTLDAHASNTLRRLQTGTTSVEITVRRDAEPGRWAVDWDLGDTVSWDLRGHTAPNGWTGRGRVIGWRMAVASGDISPVIIVED